MEGKEENVVIWNENISQIETDKVPEESTRLVNLDLILHFLHNLDYPWYLFVEIVLSIVCDVWTGYSR